MSFPFEHDNYLKSLIETRGMRESVVDAQVRKVLRYERSPMRVFDSLRRFAYAWFTRNAESLYGRYRKACQKVRGSADEKSGAGAGGAPPPGSSAAAQLTLLTRPWSPGVALVTLTPAGAGYTGTYAAEETFEDAGIRAGEVIGYRAWELRDGLLWSLLIGDCCWKPGETVEGNPGSAPYGNGVHAFKDRMEAYVYAYSCKNNDRVVVTGQVEMWGEIREHERGYRAEKARIVAIDDSPYYDAKALRKKYKVRKGK